MARKKIEKAESSAATGALFKEDVPRKVDMADVFMNLKRKPEDDLKGRTGLETTEDDTLMGRLGKRMAAKDYIDKQNLGMGSKAQKAAMADNSADKAQNASIVDDIPRSLRIEGPAMKEGLKTGTKIEKEHKKTIDAVKKKADVDPYEEIAKDHLEEHPNYYNKETGLPAMEKKLVKEPNGMGLHQQTFDKKAMNMSDPLINTDAVREGNNMAEQAKNAGNIYQSPSPYRRTPARK